MLAEYRQNGSDAAFRELVEHFLDLVYSTALRLVAGDTHQAQDITQSVFVNLARNGRDFRFAFVARAHILPFIDAEVAGERPAACNRRVSWPLSLGRWRQIMRSFILSVAFLVFGLTLGSCQDGKGTPLVITANDVVTNSVRIAPKAMTNVCLNFKFEGKSAEDIMALVGRNIKKPVIIAGGDSARTQGVVEGVLVESNSVPVGIVVSFQTRADARKAAKSLNVRNTP